MDKQQQIKAILDGDDLKSKKALFSFDFKDTDELVLFKFNVWGRHFFPQYYKSKDVEFHKNIDRSNLRAYRGKISVFVDIAFRGAAKTARTKLFLAYVILNDIDHFRRYIKVLSADDTNSKQIVVDVYNMFVSPKVAAMYPEVFLKTDFKREEKMESFTTATGVKMLADTVGTSQRGALQEDARPDLILFEDFEDRLTLYSAKKTRAIWANMEEARTGLAVGGSCIYNCNYISELGNVHTLVMKARNSEYQDLLIVPIMDKHTGKLTWPDRYPIEEINKMKHDDDDFEGERMCEPSASKDILFDREVLDAMPTKVPIKESGGFKIFKEYDPSHPYGSGNDVAAGVGLDSSTSVVINFGVFPCQVVATYKSNTIRPEAFGSEIYRENGIFGDCIAGVENNKYDSAILKAKQLGTRLFAHNKTDETKVEVQGIKEWGWNTNSATKPRMFLALAKAVEDGHLQLNDPDLIQEAKSYSRNDLMDKEEDPRMTTRHFDLLTACAIAWQMRNFATISAPKVTEIPHVEEEMTHSDIGV